MVQLRQTMNAICCMNTWEVAVGHSDDEIPVERIWRTHSWGTLGGARLERNLISRFE